MHTLANMSHSAVKMGTSSLQMSTMRMAGGRSARVAWSRSRLSLGAVPSEHRSHRDARNRKFSNHEGSTPVKNSVRKKLFPLRLSKSSSMKLD
jgi:hypothetical protein